MTVPVATTSPLETLTYDNRIVRDFLMAALIWGIVGMLVGVIVAAQLVWPALNCDLSVLSFGRLRPLHTNAVVFAFAGNAIFAGIYYSSQRLLKAGMFDRRLSVFHFWSWQLVIVLAVITLPLGMSQGKEYAELEWPIDILIALSWIGFGINLFGTIFKRREQHLYVAIWFYIATWVAITMLHVVNALVVPVSLTKSYPLFAGVQDALVQWWYGHNAVAFFLTTPFLGLMYYFLPKAAERPVYSYRWSIVHFWALIFLYIWAGPHHLLNQATPEWAQTLAVVFSIMLIIPSWGGMFNGLMTLRGAYHKVRTSPVLKFYVAAITFYGMATFEGPLLSFREVNALSHNTDWTVGHVHSGALGWNGFLVFGMVYWLVPRLWKDRTGNGENKAMWSESLANIHFWIATVAIAVYAIAMWISGIMQGLMQLAFDANSHLVYRDWIEITKASWWPWAARTAAGILYLGGAILCLFNVVMTMRGRRVVDDQAHVAARPPEPPAGVLIEAAISTGGVRQRINALHGLLERWPVVLTVLAVVALSIGSICEIVPHLIQGALTPRIASVLPYSSLELAGRDIYIREGCNNCHTQMIRTLRAEVERYGEYTRAGEHIYDRPHLWGSKRTGPDLAREGLIRPDPAWHYFHTLKPTELSPGSPMPNYPWLATDAYDADILPRKLAVLAGAPIYTPYSAEQIANATVDAQRQAAGIAAELRKQPRLAEDPDLEQKEIVALIAYMQRLGTDLGKAAPATAGKP